jgi:arsenate reductase-like glutaredoxin family protein
MKRNLICYYFILNILLGTSACTTTVYDLNGGYHEEISGFGWWLIFVAVVSVLAIILYYTFGGPEATRKFKEEKLEEYGIDSLSDIQNIGKYVGGHPRMNDLIEFCSWYKNGNELIFCKKKTKYEEYPKQAMSIPINAISDVVLEDSSTMDRRVTLGRALLVGVFALAWRKNKKNEMAFVTIEWRDGRFNHSTMFAYEGNGAMQKANTDRNAILQVLR